MSSKVCRVVVIVMLLCVVAFVATVLTQTRAEQGAATAVTEEAKKPAPEQKTEEAKKPTLEQRMDALEKNQSQILAELKQIRQTQDEILQMTQKIFTYMKRK